MLSDFNGCFASLEGNMLCVGNEGIERRWDLSQGAPVVISVLDKFAGREWCGETPYREALRLPHLPLAEPPEVELIASEDDVHGACEPHLKACVSLTYPNAKINWLHRIWPGLPIVMSSFEIRKSADHDPVEAEQLADIRGAHYYPAGERMDHFGLAADHVAYRLARFVARSDYHDNLVKEDAGLLFRKEHHRLSGHYLHLRDLARPDNGLLALKIGPPCDEQLNYPGYDFFASSLTLWIGGSGISQGERDSG